MDQQGFQHWIQRHSITLLSTSSKCPRISRSVIKWQAKTKHMFLKYIFSASRRGSRSRSVRASSVGSRRSGLPWRSRWDGGESDLCWILSQLILNPGSGPAAVQGHDDSGGDVYRRFFRSSRRGRSNVSAWTKRFSSRGRDVGACTQCLCCSFHELLGVGTSGLIRLPLQSRANFSPRVQLAGLRSWPLIVSGKLSSSDILRSALCWPHGPVRLDGLPPRSSPSRISLSRSTKERVSRLWRDRPVISGLLDRAQPYKPVTQFLRANLLWGCPTWQ